ncbi:helicase-related protein [Deltaproteobacteria bacterium TL4]
MAKLEELSRGAVVKGILPLSHVTLVEIKWHGTAVVEIFYKDATGQTGTQLLYRDNEPTLEIVTKGKPWSFDADGDKLRLASEAQRIRLAHLFDPYLAVHTSMVDPLPHQITAVYGEMLPRQPLRFLLADDPGAGKTIMTGLFIKELKIRGDLQRCLIVSPGNLVEQWQDELYRRFQLPFEILTNDRIEASRTGNIFTEIPLLIARLDKLSRNEELQEKLAQTDWDLIVCDEAHKMSATYFGGEAKYTKRFRLGRKLSEVCRNFLLLTATPHNGKEADFQLFLSLLDGDRFEGKFRDGVHTSNASDLMRRMVKEQLYKFDATPLFPERKAYTVPYKLSELEASLYNDVTEYVRNEFNRVEMLEDDGRKGTVGFALTILQRRLASSPEAIYQSLKRRRERLESRLRETELLSRGSTVKEVFLNEDDINDLDETPAEELEELEEQIMDQATAAQTIEELKIEIGVLTDLEQLAMKVKSSGKDKKWDELSNLLQDNAEMFDAAGHRRKLVIFTEHKDTLNYLTDRIRTLLGQVDAVVVIHGGIGREERFKSQEAFTQDKSVQILIATDAAGEGINLQRAHLMLNYDLPWNPNRLEQRFGRIHRIGQTEVCHLWNLVAAETREGDVYLRLLKKLEQEKEALGGAVFDVLGLAIDGAELRKLMIEAIRYGNQPEVRERLNQTVEGALDHQKLHSLIQERALARDMLEPATIQKIRQDMERMEARRLQPHFIAAFFKEAFRLLGGSLHERETNRFELTHVPATIRQRDRLIGRGEVVLPRYERICFEKGLIHVPDKPPAAFICPGHPLLDATLDLVLERYRDLMKQGAILVDDNDPEEELRILFYMDHSIQDGRSNTDGSRRVVSRKLQFVELSIPTWECGHLARMEGRDALPPLIRDAGPAPYLDYRPLQDSETPLIRSVVEQTLSSQDWENQAISYVIQALVPEHLQEIKSFKEPLVEKTRLEVHSRLTKEINYWDHRAEDLKAQERAGKINARLNSDKARQRADDLQARLQKRMTELEQERQLAPLPPVALGGALIIPGGLLARLRGEREQTPGLYAQERQRVEQLAMQAVMAAEQRLGHIPRDVSQEKVGYDIESLVPGSKGIQTPGSAGILPALRFLEVKGRIQGATTVTITKNEILTALNKPENWVLALVEVPLSENFGQTDVFEVSEEDGAFNAHLQCELRYVWKPFTKEPDFGVNSVNYNLKELWERGIAPNL